MQAATGLEKGSALSMARAVRERKVSSEALVRQAIADIERVNPMLNAITHRRFEAALEEAKLADRAAQDGSEAPLLGVPCTIKEFFAVGGAPQTGGLVARKGHIAEVDAPTVARLRKAGAIVVGTSNVPEGGLWLETHNALYGRTNNPWNLAHTPGGSSGGEGALIAAGAVPFGLGSDIGGSIRIPAAFCGITGHKPSGRALPNSGQFPAPHGEALAMLCPGPLARHATDLMTLLKILAGPDGVDPVCQSVEWTDEAILPSDVTVYEAKTNGRSMPTEEMQTAVERSRRELEKRGARIQPFDDRRLSRGFEIWAASLAEHAEESYDVILGSGREGGRVDVARELLRVLTGRPSDHTFPALALAGVGSVVQKFGRSTSKIAEEGRRLRAELRALLGPRGVLLHPPYSRPAPLHHHAWRYPLHPAYTALFNALESPVTVVPVMVGRAGLPIGVQVIGGEFADALTIQVGVWLEEVFEGYRWDAPLRGRA